MYTTASGHVSAGETVKEAFGREILEELGTEINYENAIFCNVVNFTMDKPMKDGSIFKDRAFANVYVYNYDKEYNFNYDFKEISELVKVNAKEVKELFLNEKGTIKGEIIKLINNKIEIEKTDIDFKEFLVNEQETAIEKYGSILDKVIELTQ